MLNKSPIFLFCFSRGGSNIFWNLFLSHPDACSPIVETLVIFSVKPRRFTRTGLQASLLTTQWRYFDNWHLRERRSIGPAAQRYIDKVLYEWMLKTVDDDEMRYKWENEQYTLDEVRQARLMTKNNNGLVFLSDAYLAMYPDATFFALTREPIALYESHKRRGITRSPAEFAAFYNVIAERMLDDAHRFRNYHMVRFEDVLSDPRQMIPQLYQQADLDIAHVDKIRLKAKAHIQKDGEHRTDFVGGKHYWLEMSELHSFLEPRINDLQRKNVDLAEQQLVRELTKDVCEKLGYL